MKKSVAVISSNYLDRNRIIDSLRKLGYDAFSYKPINNFGAEDFDLIIVDLLATEAQLIMKSFTHKSICYAPSNQKKLLTAATKANCKQVYRYAEFFEEILPNFNA